MEITTCEQGTVLALGNFDGLHIGHMAVINAAKEIAEKHSAVPVALIFTEHPLSVLKGEPPATILADDMRNELLKDMGVEICDIDFKSLMNMTPEEFFNKIVIEMMGAKGVCCGFNYSFGKKGEGNAEKLKALCEAKGIEFFMAPETDFEDGPVSSTRIRQCIVDGEIEKANAMLGRPFAYELVVVDGDKRGRTFGTPTINQYLPENFAEPRHGVYMSKTYLDGKTYYSVTNVGVRPTIGTGLVSSETYILDYSGDLYGRKVRVALFKYLRPERKFESLDDLKNQIKSDAQKVRDLSKVQ